LGSHFRSTASEKAAFKRQDFDLLDDEALQALAETSLALVEDGAALAESLKWLLGDGFAATIERRIGDLPPGAPARVYLPCRLYEITQESRYLARARAGIARGYASWGVQTRKVLFAVRGMLWHDPLFSRSGASSDPP